MIFHSEFQKKENIIREKRTIEASRKGLMGSYGKLAHIARYLGEPIIQEGGGLVSVSYLEDWTELEDEKDDLPVADDLDPYHIGYNFNGLKYGFNIDIKFADERHDLTVSFNGEKVYKESGGILESYAPYDEWELIIDKLHEKSKLAETRYKTKENEALNQTYRKEGANFLEEMKKKWGI